MATDAPSSPEGSPTTPAPAVLPTDFERDERGYALLPKNAIRLQDARSALSGYHFAKEVIGDTACDVLFYAEALLEELDRRSPGGYAR